MDAHQHEKADIGTRITMKLRKYPYLPGKGVAPRIQRTPFFFSLSLSLSLYVYVYIYIYISNTFLYNSTLQCMEPRIASNRDHEAPNRGTVGGGVCR